MELLEARVGARAGGSGEAGIFGVVGGGEKDEGGGGAGIGGGGGKA